MSIALALVTRGEISYIGLDGTPVVPSPGMLVVALNEETRSILGSVPGSRIMMFNDIMELLGDTFMLEIGADVQATLRQAARHLSLVRSPGARHFGSTVRVQVPIDVKAAAAKVIRENGFIKYITSIKEQGVFGSLSDAKNILRNGQGCDDGVAPVIDGATIFGDVFYFAVNKFPRRMDVTSEMKLCVSRLVRPYVLISSVAEQVGRLGNSSYEVMDVLETVMMSMKS